MFFAGCFPKFPVAAKEEKKTFESWKPLPASAQGCQIFSWYNLPKRGKIYQMTTKYTNWP
jgi:hypothetical protein